MTYSYVAGGTLAADAPSYVERQADRDLLAGLEQGEACYVLNSRQMGKSSLCVRTIVKLKQAGIRTAFCDLTKFGGRNLTAEQWYAALISEIGRELGMRDAFLAYWKENAALPPVQRLFGAITGPGLQAESPLVVFFDEIDVTLSLPFSADEFFAAIRQCYVGRATDAKLKRLSFCLLGTATPADLIKDTRVSPFNIGRRIEIADFSAEEAEPLAMGLISRRAAEPQRDSNPNLHVQVQISHKDTKTQFEDNTRLGQKLLERVMYWTGGHPYLTQRLCRAVANALSVLTPNTEHRTPSSVPNAEHRTPALVDTICSDLFLTHAARDSDDNLAFVRNRLLKSEADLAALLDLYRKVRSGKPVQDDETNPLCALLKLSGVCRVDAGRLIVRNRIYEHVFDQHWVESHLPDAEKRRQREAYRRGLFRAASISAAVMLVISGLAVFGFVSARQAKREARRANAIAEDNARNLYFAKMNVISGDYENQNFARINAYLDDTKNSKYRGFEWGYWIRKAHQETSTLRGHTDAVVEAHFSPDGHKIVTTSADSTARIWDVNTCQPLHVLRGHSDGVMAVCWSPDSKRVVTAGEDKTAIVWDAAIGTRLFMLTGHTALVRSCAYSPDGLYIATCGDDNTVRVWNAYTGAEIWQQKFAANGINAVASSPVGYRFLTTNGDGTISEWDWRTHKQLLHLKTGSIWGAQYSSDGKTVLTTSADDGIRAWDLSSKSLLFKLPTSSMVYSACFSRDARRIVAAGSDNVAVVWDVKTRTILRKLIGHSGALGFVDLSHDGKTALTASADGTAKLWDLSKDNEAKILPGLPLGYWSAQFSADGSRLLLGNKRPGLPVVETARPFATVLRTYAPRHKASTQRSNHDSGWIAAAYSGSEDRLISTGSDAVLRVGDPASGKILAGQADPERLLACSTANDLVLAISDDTKHEMRLWNCSKGTFVKLSGATVDGERGAVAPNGRWIATFCYDKYAEIWDGNSGRLVSRITQPSAVFCVLFTIDGRNLLTGCEDGKVRMWDVRAGRLIKTYGPISSTVRSLGLAPDGKRIVCGSDKGDLVMWDVESGAQTLSISEHCGLIWSIAISPDGSEVITGNFAGTPHLYMSNPSAGDGPK